MKRRSAQLTLSGKEETMRNPLSKRLLRMLKEDWKKYLVLFLLLTVTIGLISGLLVANDSMLIAAEESSEKYNVENGHFETKDRLSEELYARMEEEGITLYEQFCKELSEDDDKDGTEDATCRVFKIRDVINLACIMEGEMPTSNGEIAIDRMHADNVGVTVGDMILLEGRRYTVTGLVASADYSCLFKNNSDVMFDALSFNIGFVTDEEYASITGKNIWQYAFMYNEAPTDDEEEKVLADDMIERIAVLAATGGITSDKDEAEEIEDYVDEWTEILEDLEDRGNALKEQGDELQARADALQAEADELEKSGNDLQEEGTDLQSEGEALAKEGAELQAEAEAFRTEIETAAYTAMEAVSGGNLTLSQMMALASLSPSEQEAISGGFANLSEEEQVALLYKLGVVNDAQVAQMQDLQTRAEDLQKRVDALENRGEDLQAQADELQARGDALRAEADEVQAQADDLQAQADALEAEADSYQDVIDYLEELETYEDKMTELTDFVPAYANQAIKFAPEDMDSDATMGEYLLYVFVAVLAFIFGVTASNTITRDAAVIGTLRASGYTKREIIRHYSTLPVMVTLLSAIVGNALGYTWFKNFMAANYYRSYSLPLFETHYNMDALYKTTLFPVILMIAINMLMIRKKMNISPLKFLRKDLSTSRRKKAVKLPKFRFFSRFRLRILFQNAVDYLILFAGVFFVVFLMDFSTGMPATIDHHMENSDEWIIAPYQVILTDTEDKDGNPIETNAAGAEKYAMTSLKTVDGAHVGEEISVYGYSEGTTHMVMDEGLIPEGSTKDVFVSTAYQEKFRLAAGDEICLRELYEEKTYTFTVAGTYDYPGGLAVFMPLEEYKAVFGLKDGEFSGFLADEELSDIDEEYIYKTITIKDIMAVAAQLDHSMGSMLDIFSYACIFLAALILYLLTKLIIEKNASSISMVKVLGYTNGEITRLYVLLTSVMVFVSTVVSVLLAKAGVAAFWGQMMRDMTGWITFYISAKEMTRVVVMVMVGYAAVAFVDMRRIKHVPLTDALKNAE